VVIDDNDWSGIEGEEVVRCWKVVGVGMGGLGISRAVISVYA
jgi:hypothetical protein